MDEPSSEGTPLAVSAERGHVEVARCLDTGNWFLCIVRSLLLLLLMMNSFRRFVTYVEERPVHLASAPSEAPAEVASSS